MPKIATFDDWVDLFRQRQEDIGVDRTVIGNYRFEAKFGELDSEEIEFGAFAGERKCDTVLQIPDQRIRDALLTYLIVQGDTEFASVEQQRHLIATAPNEYDRRALVRIMTEEMRHGWQMSYLLVSYFGSSGRVEAEKLLQRRAFKRNRLLGAFNEEVRDWLDFLVYTEFQDRDGKYQLTMFRRSAFAPLACSMPPMLKEEAFHLGTGHNGLKRVVKAGKIPSTLTQKCVNKWVPACYDLFGTDGSSSAHWAYTLGLKGRYNEGATLEPADLEHLNEMARSLYVFELEGLIADLSRAISEDQPKLRLPDLKFRRRVGDYARQPYAVDGTLLAVRDAETTYDLSSLRPCVSAGEALPPELFRRWKERFGTEILDGIGTTEILHIFISNQAGRVKPGSSGLLVPGYEAKIIGEDGDAVKPSEMGNLLVKGESTCAYYWNHHEKTKQTIKGEWIVTGDKYYQDEDGYYWYAGRADDMLKVGGIWVSPIEVENTLLQHEAVLEAAVVGHEDDDRLVKPKAFVVLNEGYTASPALEDELKGFVRDKIAPYKYPRWIAFMPELPKTATGKIQRFKLREHCALSLTFTRHSGNAIGLISLSLWERVRVRDVAHIH